MLCSSCHGHHFIVHSGQMMPCPECGGMGEVHCCDGLTVQHESCPSSVDEASRFVAPGGDEARRLVYGE